MLAVRRFSTEAEAVALANDSDFGLAAAVFSSHQEVLDRIGSALRVGIVWKNCSQPCFPQMPWGGLKKSGIGRELGDYGMDAFLEPKSVIAYSSNSPLGWYTAPSSKL